MFHPAFKHTVMPVDNPRLPSWLQPTKYQQLIPHHPIIDLLPWPSVRNKLICRMAQPLEMRPPSARDPMAPLALMSDMDDEEEGIKIAGSQGFNGEYWEVGQVIFDNWWWAFEPSIIKNTNRLREKRGAAKLLLNAASGESTQL
jgi:Domain of unknown function (DUF3425)